MPSTRPIHLSQVCSIFTQEKEQDIAQYGGADGEYIVYFFKK